MNLQDASLALLKHGTLVFTESGVYLAVASPMTVLAGLEGPSGSEQACAHLGDLLQVRTSSKKFDFTEAPPQAEKLTPRCVIYLSFKELMHLWIRARSGAGGPSIT